MRENYNGYELSTAWDDEALGFGFSVHDKNGAEVSRSVDPYFYEENALTAARAAADALPAQGIVTRFHLIFCAECGLLFWGKRVMNRTP